MCYHVSTPKKKDLKALAERKGWVYDASDHNPHYHVSGFAHPQLPAALQAATPALRPVTWGFVPGGLSQQKAVEFFKGAYSLNAKAETAFSLPIYREAALRRRCLHLVDGFFEWKHEGKAKIPHYIQMPDHEPFALGGLYNPWRDEESGEALLTANILTTAANELMATIHNTKKRMPLIVPQEHWEAWLDPATDRAQVERLLVPFPEGRLQAHEVGTLITTRGADTDVPEVQQ